MRGAHHDAYFIIHQRATRMLSSVRSGRHGGNGEVDFASEQCTGQLMVGRLHHVQLDSRQSSTYVVQNRRQNIGDQARKDADPCQALGGASKKVDLLERAVQAGFQKRSVWQ